MTLVTASLYLSAAVLALTGLVGLGAFVWRSVRGEP